MINLRNKNFQVILFILMLLTLIVIFLEISDQVCPPSNGEVGLDCQALLEKYVVLQAEDESYIPLNLSSEKLRQYDFEDVVKQRIIVAKQEDIPNVNGLTCYPYGFVADSLSKQARKYVSTHEALHLIGYSNETEVNYQAALKEPLGFLMTIIHSIGKNFEGRKITEYHCAFGSMWSIFKFYFLNIKSL